MQSTRVVKQARSEFGGRMRRVKESTRKQRNAAVVQLFHLPAAAKVVELLALSFLAALMMPGILAFSLVR